MNFVQRYCLYVTLESNDPWVRRIDYIVRDSPLKLFVESQSPDFKPVCIPGGKVDSIVLASSLVLFNHLLRITLLDEKAAPYRHCRNTVLKLNYKSSYSLSLLVFCRWGVWKQLDVSYFVSWKMPWVVKVIRGFRHTLREFKDSLWLIKRFLSVDMLPWVQLYHKQSKVSSFGPSHKHDDLPWKCGRFKVLLNKRYKLILAQVYHALRNLLRQMNDRNVPVVWRCTLISKNRVVYQVSLPHGLLWEVFLIVLCLLFETLIEKADC